MRERRDVGRSLLTRLLLASCFLIVAAPTCGGGGGGSASKFCGDWAAAWCHKVWTCTPDPGSSGFAGSSEADCTKGYAALCSQPQPAGQTFDVSCAGKQVNEAAKMSCLNKLNTVSCDDFNAPTYSDDCSMVCTEGGTGGTGGTGATGGTGGTSGGSCGNVQPCGGDLVGTWTINKACISSLTPDSTCAGDTISNTSATETGTLSFTSAGTYTSNVSLTLSYTEMIPASCISGLTCADLQSQFAIIGATATCTGSTVCTCSISLAANGAETGTFTASGTSLTTTSSASGNSSSMGYCVQGNTVHFLHFDTAGQLQTEEIGTRQ